MDNRPWTVTPLITQPDTMSNTDTLITCIMGTCNTNPYIAMLNNMVIIVILTMLTFTRPISCFNHDNCDYCMLNCNMYCNICLIALDNLFKTPIEIDYNNKITHGCIFSSCTVQKHQQKINLLVLTRTTRHNKVYLLINNIPAPKLLKFSSKYPFLAFIFFKNIKNHGFNGLTLKTEVFNVIFQLDLVSKMSTKSCARTLKNTWISSIEHPQKTALKNNFFDSVIQNFSNKHHTNPLYFITIKNLTVFTAYLCHNPPVFKTVYFFLTGCQDISANHGKLDPIKIHVLNRVKNTPNTNGQY